MDKLGKLIKRAQELASTDTEKSRVQNWKSSIWDYMVRGRELYLEHQLKKDRKAEL
jgi:hypothetical protein